MTARRGAGRPSETFSTEQRILPVGSWPITWQDALAAAVRPAGDLFRPAGPGANWAPATLQGRCRALGRFLWWCSRTGVDLETTPVGSIADETRIRAYIKDAEKFLSAATRSQALRELRLMLQALVSDRSWAWLNAGSIRPAQIEIRRSRKTVITFDTAVLARSVMSYMDLHADGQTIEEALLYRDALMTLMQCLFPLRLRNFSELVLGRSLVMHDHGVQVVFKDEETKNYRRIDSMLPEWSLSYLCCYLDTCRPILLRKRVLDAVWVNRRGQPLQYGGVAPAFRAIGRRWVGMPITCHQFRHSAATTWLTANPTMQSIASGVLSHRGLRSVNQFYDKSGDNAARETWARLVNKAGRGG